MYVLVSTLLQLIQEFGIYATVCLILVMYRVIMFFVVDDVVLCTMLCLRHGEGGEVGGGGRGENRRGGE